MRLELGPSVVASGRLGSSGFSRRFGQRL